MEKFEEQIHDDLQQYLLSVNEVDLRRLSASVVPLWHRRPTQASWLPHDKDIRRGAGGDPIAISTNGQQARKDRQYRHPQIKLKDLLLR